MATGEISVAHSYLERFTNQDLELLRASALQLDRTEDPRKLLRANPARLNELLNSQMTFDAVFGTPNSNDPLLIASPFFVFTVAVHRVVAQLSTRSYVLEWLGPGRRMPVFDVGQLQGFMDSPWHRLFLAELLSSYTHVASGSVVVPTRRGLRRHRFSELDPVRLAGLLEVIPEAEHPGIFRRLGDLALFLTGVFPDYIARKGFGPIEEGRLLRASGIRKGPSELGPSEPGLGNFGDRGAVGLLEQLGRRWYQSAFTLLTPPVAENVVVLGEMPKLFHQARRILGMITEDVLFSHRDRWFGFTSE